MPPTAPEPSSYLVDLELTHFYLTHTYKTLWGREEAQLVWRDIIFPLALKNPPLLDGIFAMATMHRLVVSGDLSPEERSMYTSTALRKQTAALAGFVPLLHSLNNDTAEVAFPMAILVAYWAFASPRLPPELSILSITVDLGPSFSPAPSLTRESAITQFLELLRRIRPTHHIMNQARERLLGGRLSPLAQSPSIHDLPALPDNTQHALTTLRAHLESVPEIVKSFHGAHPITSLDFMFRLSLQPEWGELMVGWAVRIPEDFVEEVRRRNPAALTVLAYWAASFHCVDDRWWASGWPVALIVEVSSEVAGVAEPWGGLVGWARRYVGLETA